MWRRWIIRAFFMLPILLCVGGWAWSGGHIGYIRYEHGYDFITCITQRGTIGVAKGSDVSGPPPVSRPDHWESGARVLEGRGPTYPSWLGFSFRHSSFASVDYHALDLPYWFLIVVFSFALLFVWRKTRPRGPRGAFPVEVKASERA